MPTIDLRILETLDHPGITPHWGGLLAEAGAVCLEACSHCYGVNLIVSGFHSGSYTLQWSPATPQMVRALDEQDRATELGAYGVAILLVCGLTGHQVCSTARKGTGVDFWLGDSDEDSRDVLPFQRKARLEVSGIRNGNRRDVKSRLQVKWDQVSPSAATGTPAYIAIVEFGEPGPPWLVGRLFERDRQLHRRSMLKAELADVARLSGDVAEAESCFAQACELEAAAARLVIPKPENEPSRSVLFRSAAALAFECAQLPEAERLAVEGLAGHPPDDIAEELRELYEKAVFLRHASLRGISVGSEEVQLSIAGASVRQGIAPVHEVLSRVAQVNKLVQRTVERLLDRPYRDVGRKPADLRGYELYWVGAQAGSLAVNLRMARPMQQKLPEFGDQGIDPEVAIEEIMACLGLFNRGSLAGLQQRIQGEAYLRNFIGIARNMAPDGKSVRYVALASAWQGRPCQVALTTPRKDVVLTGERVPPSSEGEGEPIEIRGTLLFADARRTGRGQIRLVDEQEASHNVHVPEGMMSDIVKPLWEQTVVVKGQRVRGDIWLRDVWSADDDT